jgi:hypothetical protein
MDEVTRRADACAERLLAGAEDDAVAGAAAEITALLDAVRQMDSRYAFDSEGRPSALTAVRHALPSMEGDLLEAIVEDHACEVAALREAMYQLVLAAGRRG